MNKGIFITGTGTEVGKTIVAAGILREMIENGKDAVPFKPVQTGGIVSGDSLLAPDLEFCLDIAGLSPDNDEKAIMAPYIYEPACSPHLAGRMQNRYPHLKYISHCMQSLLKKHEMVITEGAGGVMAPVNEKLTMFNLMAELDLPVILVAHAGLGTINHTLLSIKMLRKAKLKILGVLFNEIEPPSEEDEFIRRDNPAIIRSMGRVPILGTLHHSQDITAESNDFWKQFEKIQGI